MTGLKQPMRMEVQSKKPKTFEAISHEILFEPKSKSQFTSRTILSTDAKVDTSKLLTGKPSTFTDVKEIRKRS